MYLVVIFRKEKQREAQDVDGDLGGLVGNLLYIDTSRCEGRHESA
jgi:hypothetical protein